MRRFALVVVALLLREWHCPITTAATPPPALVPTPPSHTPQVPPPPPQQMTPPKAPEAPRRRGSPHRRAPSPPRSVAPPKQDPAPPRMVIPPQQPVVAAPPPAPPREINYTTSVTTLLVFGDSTVDPGNNNWLRTTAKANFLPYGMNFYGRRPTGRFCNGRLASDMFADKLGIARSIPAFLDPTLKLGQLKKGVSFASAGSGYDDNTAKSLNVVSFSRQIEHLWSYKLRIRKLVGPRRAELIVKKATFLISAGTNDVLLHYLASNQSDTISQPQYENYLVTLVANYTQALRTLGGRRFVFVGLPPVGCLPIARTLRGTGADRCDENLNELATSFNSKLVELVHFLKYEAEIRASYIDIYTIISEATKDPNKFGLSEVSRGCCGTGVIEVGQTCKGRKTCADPGKYLYWDAVHPTERTYQIITDDVIMNSIAEIYS